MRNDFLLVGAILIFIFLLWVYSGGPNKPISFAGPYITPITDTDSVQHGYQDVDGNANETHSFFQRVSTTFGGGSSSNGGYYGSMDEVPAAVRSPYAGKISLEGGNAAATNITDEYLEIRSQSGVGDISISGWSLVSEKTGAHATIPNGLREADGSGSLSAIILNSGDTAIVSSSKSPVDYSFKESSCTGYLDTNGRYNPSLSTGSCPAPLDELGNFYGRTASEYDKCAPYVNSLSSCRVPNTDDARIPSSCEDFINKYLDYRGCVTHHRADADFYGDTWRIYLGQSKELWRSSNDTIRLVDQNNKTVDLYSY